MAVYSTKFYAGEVPTGTTTLYTVPAGYVAVIRDAHFYADISAAAEFALEVTNPGPTNSILYFNNDFEPGAYVAWSGRAVLNAGDLLILVTTESYIVSHVSGYLLATT